MPYLFTCPHCQTRTQVDDRYSGQSGNCVSCGGEIDIPQFIDRAETSVAGKVSQGNAKTLRWVTGVIVSAVIVACFLFAVIRFGGQTISQMTNSRDQGLSIKNLQRIAEALNAYAADHGTYPPPATIDASGTPLHSWRVLILPYLGEEELYNQINLSVAWNDQTNDQGFKSRPAVYGHPAQTGYSNYFESAYFLVTGQGTLFPMSGPLGPGDIVDDASQTILVVEAMPNTPSSSWMEPVDVSFTNMKGEIGGDPTTEVGGYFAEGVSMATADGRGHFLKSTTDSFELRSLITPRGGERLPDDMLD